MPKPLFKTIRFLPLALLACLTAAPAAVPAPISVASPASPVLSESGITQCLALQSRLSSPKIALSALNAKHQVIASQRSLEQAQHQAQIQALKSENERLFYVAIISVLSLLLAAAAGFGLLLRKRHLQLRKLSEIDALTGLNNRHAATEALNQMTQQRGPEGTRHVLFLIDIDHFKRINDSYGHHTGDEVLVEMAKRLKTACRPTDLVARWGGEEFLVACPNLTREQAEQIACRLRTAMAYTLNTANGPHAVTISLGLAPIPFFEAPASNTTAHRWDYALRMADTALYASKRTRDAWVGYWGAQLPDEATAIAALEQPEAAKGVVTVMSSVLSIVPLPRSRSRTPQLKHRNAEVISA